MYSNDSTIKNSVVLKIELTYNLDKRGDERFDRIIELRVFGDVKKRFFTTENMWKLRFFRLDESGTSMGKRVVTFNSKRVNHLETFCGGGSCMCMAVGSS